MAVSKKRTLCNWVVSWNSAFFIEFLLERTSDKLWLVRLLHFGDFFWKTNNVSLLLSRKQLTGTSLAAQRLRIRLPMQGTQVQSLVREDPTRHGATKPMRHNYWACALQPVSHNYWSPRATTTEACAPRARTLQQREATAMRSPCTAMKSSSRSPQLEKACAQQRPNAAKNKLINKLKNQKKSQYIVSVWIQKQNETPAPFY